MMNARGHIPSLPTEQRTQQQYNPSDDSLSSGDYLIPTRLIFNDEEIETTAIPYSKKDMSNHHSERRVTWVVFILIALAFLSVSVCIGVLVYERTANNNYGGKRGFSSYDDDDFIGTYVPTQSYETETVLGPGEYLTRGEFVQSPSQKYQIGLSTNGNLVLQNVETNEMIWSSGTVGGYRCYMQDDGNLVVRNFERQSLWSSGTSKNNDSRFIIDDGGRIGIIYTNTFIWIEGVPRAKYNGPSSADLSFPIRGTFYYAWYPETWTVSGQWAKYKPDLGHYNSADPMVVESHIDALEYGNIDLGIISWFGPSTNDRARITLLMDKSISLQSPVKWTVYYEDEMDLNPTPAQIRDHLWYLKKWFAWHPKWAHIDGKPVIFVYNDSDCDVARRWKQGSDEEWFVVLKWFHGFKDCPVQPDGWHQYAPTNAVQGHERYAFSISPGFWKATSDSPRLPRLSKMEWCQAVQDMVNSQAPFQLITTFNEAGEGTMIEASSANWPSESSYGYYLDCLHDIY